MKSLKILLSFFVLLFLSNLNMACAQDYLKNFYGYELKNVNIREFGVLAHEVITSYNGPDRGVPVEGVRNAYVYTGKDYTYFIKLYAANQNTNIYVVSNEEYNVNDNDLTRFLDKCGYKYGKLEDKTALKEYENDFYTLARKKQLGNFYISPDMIKPLKTGMAKINNKLAKDNKKTSAIPYSVDSAPINLTCVDTTSYYDADSKLSFIQREYRLKEKSNKYVHAFEYIVTNKNTSTATISVSSERLAGLKDVTTESFVDLDRLDLVDTVASFPPVLVCTAGLSIVGSVPNWLRMARIAKEASRYAHALPENYSLRPQGNMRILVLKYKDNPKPLNFNIKFSEQSYNVAF